MATPAPVRGGATRPDGPDAPTMTEPSIDWGAEIARHDRRVVLSLVARGVRLDRAREIAQETWARLVERHRLGELPRVELPGLAITQAGFLARDDVRRARAVTSIEAAADLADPGVSADERLVSQERLERARAELGRCPPQARRVFEAVYEHPEEPHAEAAKRLGISVQRVRQTLCEVRARLRRALEEDDHG